MSLKQKNTLRKTFATFAVAGASLGFAGQSHGISITPPVNTTGGTVSDLAQNIQTPVTCSSQGQSKTFVPIQGTDDKAVFQNGELTGIAKNPQEAVNKCMNVGMKPK